MPRKRTFRGLANERLAQPRHKSANFKRHDKTLIDAAVRDCLSSIASEGSVRAAFAALLLAVRRQPGAASVLRRSPQLVFALRNMACFATSFVAQPETWESSARSAHPAVASLAQHLFARYAVPRFLSLVWFGDDSQAARVKRSYYVDHARGRPFRKLALPFTMTRSMEHRFLRSPAHLSFEAAVRRSEALALGTGEAIADAIIATRLGRDLSRACFWRTVVRFIARYRDELGPDEVGPIIDFIHAVRHVRIDLQGAEGLSIDPPEPTFSMKGRTPGSLRRRVAEWHRLLRRSPITQRAWAPSAQRPLRIQAQQPAPGDPLWFWELVELTTSEELRMEGQALQHCVVSYVDCCMAGRSRIWSLRRRRLDGAVRSALTIEVDPRSRSIVQARGLYNRAPSARLMALVDKWAARERLVIRLD